MHNWFSSLQQGLSRSKPTDHLSQTVAHPKLSHLFPFFVRHWKKAIVGTVLVFVGSAAMYVLPLVQRFLIDKLTLRTMCFF